MTRYLLGMTLLLLIGCQNAEPDPKMKQAFELHTIALQTYDSLQGELKAIDAQSLTTEGQQALAKIQETSTTWHDNLAEVPGFEHEEGHDHDHDHDHGDDVLKDLPPQEMLELQQALLEEIQGLLLQTRQLATADTSSAPTNP